MPTEERLVALSITRLGGIGTLEPSIGGREDGIRFTAVN
jgi:hypothetical protein